MPASTIPDCLQINVAFSYCICATNSGRGSAYEYHHHFRRFTKEQLCGGAGYIKFLKLVFLVFRITGLVSHLNGQPHLGRSVSQYHIQYVRSAIRYDSRENNVKIGLTHLKMKVTMVGKVLHIKIDFRLSTILAFGIVKKLLYFRNYLGEHWMVAGNQLLKYRESLSDQLYILSPKEPKYP